MGDERCGGEVRKSPQRGLIWDLYSAVLVYNKRRKRKISLLKGKEKNKTTQKVI